MMKRFSRLCFSLLFASFVLILILRILWFIDIDTYWCSISIHTNRLHLEWQKKIYLLLLHYRVNFDFRVSKMRLLFTSFLLWKKVPVFCCPNEWDSTVIVCDQFDNSNDTNTASNKSNYLTLKWNTYLHKITTEIDKIVQLGCCFFSSLALSLSLLVSCLLAHWCSFFDEIPFFFSLAQVWNWLIINMLLSYDALVPITHAQNTSILIYLFFFKHELQ